MSDRILPAFANHQFESIIVKDRRGSSGGTTYYSFCCYAFGNYRKRDLNALLPGSKAALNDTVNAVNHDLLRETMGTEAIRGNFLE